MEEIDPEFGRLADAILDGDPIDWLQAESSVSDRQRRLLDGLRLLAAIAAMHRQRPSEPESDGSGLGSRGVAPAGTTFWGRLRLIEQLGAGSFGTVFRAWDPRLQREVAIKMLPVPAPGSEDRAAALMHEGRLLARLRHPGIVTIYDADQMGNVVGLCMELVPGRTLEARIEQDGPLTPGETVGVGLALCDALSAVHDAGLLHRDVKASNVMMADDGRIVLMDFGAAHEVKNVEPSEHGAGTPLYLAPEVLDGGVASVTSDVYSLGVLLHRASTGSYPVKARSRSELRTTHERRLADESYTVRNAYPDIPAGLARVVDRAIDPRPDRRFANASAMARALSTLRRRSRHASRRCLSQRTTPLATARGCVTLVEYYRSLPMRKERRTSSRHGTPRSLASSESFESFVLDQLAAVGEVLSRKMFGGVGLYGNGLFFGIIANDVLYLKVDDQTKHRYITAGSKPFKPYAGRPGTMRYYAVPIDVLESAPELARWAKEAVAVAQRAASPKSASR